jgi:LemA protein
LYAIAIYNRLVTMRNRVRNAWSQIDVQLRRRHDLVPNLVESMKGQPRRERERLYGT